MLPNDKGMIKKGVSCIPNIKACSKDHFEQKKDLIL